MLFKELVESHPEIVQDRHRLSFSRHSPLGEIAVALAGSGVVMLEEALAPAMLEPSGQAFRRFVEASDATHDSSPPDRKRRSQAERDRAAFTGNWYSPWAVRDGHRFPAAVVMSAVIRSWAWNVVEEICGSSHIVILLKWCMARHNIDRPLGIGGHQDAKLIAADVPFAMWIPMGPVTPPLNSGLGFVVPAPDDLLETLPHGDVGADYVLRDPAGLWIPPYATGDVTIHSRFSPYFRAGYGTSSDLFSLEMRAMARRAASPKYLDPAIYVSRRNGIPTIVETASSSDNDAEVFFASADLAGVTSKEVRRVVL